MIEYINVPKIFNSFPQWNNPPYQKGPHLERYFDKFILKKNLDSVNKDISYIPIYWTDYYVSRENCSFGKDKSKIRDLQKYIDYLPRNKKYFTVVRNDDGIMNDVSGLDIIIFGACGFDNGGIAHIPIPLLCDPMPIDHIDKNIKKDIFVSFIGSMTHDIRKKMFEEFSIKDNCFIKDVGCKHIFNVREYALILARSVFSLCPRGYGKTSFRLYESMQVGSIPIYIYDDPWIPFQDEIKWENFCVFIHEKDINNLYRMISSFTEEKIRKMKNSMHENYFKYFTMEQSCKMILKTLNKIL